MICTSSYKDWNSDKYITYSISGDRGKSVNYDGKYYKGLAPKMSFWKIWHDNIGKISDEENNRYYVQKYWEEVLSKLDPEQVYRDLNYSILLCYESNEEFCHRHIVAAWLEILLGEEVKEAKCEEYQIEYTSRPEYIKEYLEEIMKTNINMRGFKSLRALYLFEKGEKLETKANELELITEKCYDNYRQAACFLRCEADMVEEEYKNNRRVLEKTKQE